MLVKHTKKAPRDFSKCFYFLTWARRFELPTFWSVAKRSIQLSYAHIMPQTGIEPVREYKSRRILSPVRLPVPPLRHNQISLVNGTNRARTCDPLLVRQVLSQLSYDPLGIYLFIRLSVFNDPEGTRTLDLQRDRLAF